MNRRSLLARLAVAPAAIAAGLALAREAMAEPLAQTVAAPPIAPAPTLASLRALRRDLGIRTPVIVNRRVTYEEWQSWPRRNDWAIESRDLLSQNVTLYWVGPNSDLAERGTAVIPFGGAFSPEAPFRYVNVLRDDVQFGHPDPSSVLAGRLWRPADRSTEA